MSIYQPPPLPPGTPPPPPPRYSNCQPTPNKQPLPEGWFIGSDGKLTHVQSQYSGKVPICNT